MRNEQDECGGVAVKEAKQTEWKEGVDGAHTEQAVPGCGQSASGPDC